MTVRWDHEPNVSSFLDDKCGPDRSFCLSSCDICSVLIMQTDCSCEKFIAGACQVTPALKRLGSGVLALDWRSPNVEVIVVNVLDSNSALCDWPGAADVSIIARSLCRKILVVAWIPNGMVGSFVSLPVLGVNILRFSR